MKEVAAGNVQFTLATQASVASFVESGLVRVIAIAASRRLSTLRCSDHGRGGPAGIELSNWFGIMGPRGMSPRLVSLINAAFNKALALPVVRSTLARQGIEPVMETPEQFAARLQADARGYQKIIEQIGLTPQ